MVVFGGRQMSPGDKCLVSVSNIKTSVVRSELVSNGGSGTTSERAMQSRRVFEIAVNV